MRVRCNGVCHTLTRSRDTKYLFFFQAEDGIRDYKVTGVQTCALPIYNNPKGPKQRALQNDKQSAAEVLEFDFDARDERCKDDDERAGGEHPQPEIDRPARFLAHLSRNHWERIHWRLD